MNENDLDVISAWVTNIASLAERARTGDRYELCIDRKYWNSFPEHKGLVELIVEGAAWKAQIGKRDGVSHLYFWTNCIAADGRKEKITKILSDAGIGVGDTPLLVPRGRYRFEMQTA